MLANRVGVIPASMEASCSTTVPGQQENVIKFMGRSTISSQTGCLSFDSQTVFGRGTPHDNLYITLNSSQPAPIQKLNESNANSLWIPSI